MAATPVPLEALADRGFRDSISGSAVRLFLNAADRWGLSVAERCALLGDISRQTLHNWASGRSLRLGRDQLERISLVLGIFKGLRLLFAEEDAALRWLKSANRDTPFSGRSPLETVCADGIGGLYAVRRYLDAWRGVR